MNPDYQGNPSAIIRALALLKEGASRREIADGCFISITSVKRYLKSLRIDYGCDIRFDWHRGKYVIHDGGVFDLDRID